MIIKLSYDQTRKKITGPAEAPDTSTSFSLWRNKNNFRMFFRMWFRILITHYLQLFHSFQTIAKNWRQKIVGFWFWFHNTIIFLSPYKLAIIPYRLKWAIFFYRLTILTKIMLSPFRRQSLIYRQFGDRIEFYRPMGTKLYK